MQEIQGVIVGMQSLPWSLRNVIRVLSIVCGIVNVVLGLIVSITLNAYCLLAGIIMMLFGATILAIEATFLCGLFAFGSSAKKIADFFEKKPIWIRCVFYAVTAIIPILLCHDILSILSFMSSIVCAAACFVIAVSQRRSGDTVSFVEFTNPSQIP